jgi:hypothetical protein
MWLPPSARMSRESRLNCGEKIKGSSVSGYQVGRTLFRSASGMTLVQDDSVWNNKTRGGSR